MPRYIDADKALEFIKETNANYHWLLAQYNAQWVYDFIESQPTADVVPKSELSIIGVQNMALEDTNVDLKRRLVIAEAVASVAIGKASDMVSESKREVAREIFEEIDSMIFGTIIPDDCAIISIAMLAEIKKKYTEDQHNG